MDENITISLPEELIDKLKEKIKETNFDSVSNYIIYILKQVVSKEETKYEKERTYTKEEEKQIKEKLKQLGYL